MAPRPSACERGDEAEPEENDAAWGVLIVVRELEASGLGPDPSLEEEEPDEA